MCRGLTDALDDVENSRLSNQELDDLVAPDHTTNVLDTICRGVVDDLSPEAHEKAVANIVALGTVAGKGPIRTGSIYSGCELGHAALMLFFTMMVGANIVQELNFQHTMGWEWIGWKRTFILATFPDLQHLFGNAKDLANESAWCYVTNGMTVIPSLHLLYLGFSCRDWSLLRDPHGHESDRAVLDGEGSSGSTCRYAMSYPGSGPPWLGPGGSPWGSSWEIPVGDRPGGSPRKSGFPRGIPQPPGGPPGDLPGPPP